MVCSVGEVSVWQEARTRRRCRLRNIPHLTLYQRDVPYEDRIAALLIAKHLEINLHRVDMGGGGKGQLDDSVCVNDLFQLRVASVVVADAKLQPCSADTISADSV